MNDLKGSNIHLLTRKLNIQIRSDYQRLVSEIFPKFSDILSINVFTLEKFKWALATVWSRCFDIDIPVS